jgi:hypothetical protein
MLSQLERRVSVHYVATERQLTINWELGTLFITGPKVLEVFDQFSTYYKATMLKVDGMNILSLTTHLR